MVNDTKMAKFIRGLVKTVFILCYIAFMWASIHHVATYFNNFEADSNDTFGSYMVAGAFDITALVTTIGVMFFRKNMPRYIQGIVWAFIIGITVYSYFINWEYAAHYQHTDLIMQFTGQTIPVYDNKDVLHYVPEMKANTMLLYINPLAASGFTVFALVYSVIAEFFGTKLPTVEELKAKQKYLEDTSEIEKSIKKLEGNRKEKSLLQTAKEKAIEAKDVWKEITKSEENDEESQRKARGKPEENDEENDEESQTVAKENAEESQSKPERNTDELNALPSEKALGKFTKYHEENDEESQRKAKENLEESKRKPHRKAKENLEESIEENTEKNMPSWLSVGGSTISLKIVEKYTNIPMKTLRNRVGKKEIRRTKSEDIVYKDSLIEWLKAEGYLQENNKIVELKAIRNAEESEKKTVGNAEESEEENQTVAAQ